MNMKKIVLTPNPKKDADFLLSAKVIDVLKGFCSEIYVENTYKELLKYDVSTYEPNAFPTDAELILVLGGDGSMLHAAKDALENDVPLLGINMGRVGYLASVEPNEISDLADLASDRYIEKRHMTLSVSVKGLDGKERFLGCALNEVVVDGMGHLADMRLYDGNSFLDYRADGLIAATPTGSTAYSFSAGGPVMDESMNAICLTPVCPRSFFSRSLLFSPESVLRIMNTTSRDGDMQVILDGQGTYPLRYGEEVIVCRSEKDVKILTLKQRNLLDVLCTKMDTRHF